MLELSACILALNHARTSNDLSIYFLPPSLTFVRFSRRLIEEAGGMFREEMLAQRGGTISVLGRVMHLQVSDHLLG